MKRTGSRHKVALSAAAGVSTPGAASAASVDEASTALGASGGIANRLPTREEALRVVQSDMPKSVARHAGHIPAGARGQLAALLQAVADDSKDVVTIRRGALLGKPQHLAALAAFVSNARTIVSLSVNFCGLGDRGAMTMAAGVWRNESLQQLSLRDNDIGPQGATSLAVALASNTALQALDLSANAVGDEGATKIAQALIAGRHAHVNNLELASNAIGDAGAARLGATLRANTVLTHLNLTGNPLADQGARHIAEALRVNSALVTLDLSNTHVAADGAKRLAEALSGPGCNHTLRTLVLRNHVIASQSPGVGNVGANALMTALNMNTTLTALDVSCDDGGAASDDILNRIPNVDVVEDRLAQRISALAHIPGHVRPNLAQSAYSVPQLRDLVFTMERWRRGKTTVARAGDDADGGATNTPAAAPGTTESKSEFSALPHASAAAASASRGDDPEAPPLPQQPAKRAMLVFDYAAGQRLVSRDTWEVAVGRNPAHILAEMHLDGVNKAKKALVCACAFVNVLDLITDMIVAAQLADAEQWIACFLTTGLVLLSTALSCRELWRAGRRWAALAQVASLAIVESAVNVLTEHGVEGIPVDIMDRDPPLYGTEAVLRLKLIEAFSEAAPQLLVQGFLAFHTGFTGALAVSLVVSIVSVVLALVFSDGIAVESNAIAGTGAATLERWEVNAERERRGKADDLSEIRVTDAHRKFVDLPPFEYVSLLVYRGLEVVSRAAVSVLFFAAFPWWWTFFPLALAVAVCTAWWTGSWGPSPASCNCHPDPLSARGAWLRGEGVLLVNKGTAARGRGVGGDGTAANPHDRLPGHYYTDGGEEARQKCCGPRCQAIGASAAYAACLCLPPGRACGFSLWRVTHAERYRISQSWSSWTYAMVVSLLSFPGVLHLTMPAWMTPLVGGHTMPDAAFASLRAFENFGMAAVIFFGADDTFMDAHTTAWTASVTLTALTLLLFPVYLFSVRDMRRQPYYLRAPSLGEHALQADDSDLASKRLKRGQSAYLAKGQELLRTPSRRQIVPAFKT